MQIKSVSSFPHASRYINWIGGMRGSDPVSAPLKQQDETDVNKRYRVTPRPNLRRVLSHIQSPLDPPLSTESLDSRPLNNCLEYVYIPSMLGVVNSGAESCNKEYLRHKKILFHFISADAVFKGIICRIAKAEKQPGMLKNKASTSIEHHLIIDAGVRLMHIDRYAPLGLKGVFISMFYVYYALNILEQSCDFLCIDDLQHCFAYRNYKLVKELIHHVSAGDIMLDGHNVSRVIRRGFMGMGPVTQREKLQA